MMNDILQKEIDRCEDMKELISNRCEHNLFTPLMLCTLRSPEIEELLEILGNYNKILACLKEN